MKKFFLASLLITSTTAYAQNCQLVGNTSICDAGLPTQYDTGFPTQHTIDPMQWSDGSPQRAGETNYHRDGSINYDIGNANSHSEKAPTALPESSYTIPRLPY